MAVGQFSSVDKEYKAIKPFNTLSKFRGLLNQVPLLRAH